MKSYTINLDWFEVVLIKDNIGECVSRDGFEFSSIGKPKDVFGFKKYMKIKHQNQDFATLFFEPTERMRFTKSNACILKLNNTAFYRSGIFTKDLHYFLNLYGFEFYKIRELHIAVDSEGLIEKHDEFFRNKVVFQRGAKIYFTYGGHDNYYGKAALTLGSRKSDKFIRFYNKTQEIEDSGKTYIEKFWKNNKLQRSDNPVDRMELVLKRRELETLNIDIKELESPNYLTGLFQKCSKGYLDFKNIETNEVHKVIDLSSGADIIFKKEKTIVYREKTQSMKTTIKTLFLYGISTGAVNEIQRAEALATEYNLTDWMNKSKGRWLKENALFAIPRRN